MKQKRSLSSPLFVMGRGEATQKDAEEMQPPAPSFKVGMKVLCRAAFDNQQREKEWGVVCAGERLLFESPVSACCSLPDTHTASPTHSPTLSHSLTDPAEVLDKKGDSLHYVHYLDCECLCSSDSEYLNA